MFVNRSTCDEDTYKNDFYILFPSDLDLWTFDLIFAPAVTGIQCYVSAEFEVFMAFWFRL